MEVLVKKLHPDAIIPEYRNSGDAGFDFYCLEDIAISPNEAAILPTGLAMAIPEGYEMQIRLRSSAALHTPLIIANAPGTIDSGYRGEIGILVRNLSEQVHCVIKGERIAQGVVVPVIRAEFSVTDELPPSERGACGFGSTGA